MYSETPWLCRLLLELAERGLIEPGQPLPECRPDSDQGRLISDYLFLLGQLHGLAPRFSFKGSHYPESEGLANVLQECHRDARLYVERIDVGQSPLPPAQLEALDALEQTLAPPAEFGDGTTARERWRRALVFHSFAAFTPMFKWPDGPWRGRLQDELERMGYREEEFQALERFVAPYEGRDYALPPYLSAPASGPRSRLSPLASDGGLER